VNKLGITHVSNRKTWWTFAKYINRSLNSKIIGSLKWPGTRRMKLTWNSSSVYG
jgi:hypothetical protein